MVINQDSRGAKALGVRRVWWWSGAIALLLAGQVVPPTAAQETDADPPRSEQALIASLEELRDAPEAQFTPADPQGYGVRHKESIIATVDELLAAYPNTSFRDEALILKMEMLAHLSRVGPKYLQQLLDVTVEIGRSRPQGRLAEETAFHSIQAFVLAARLENMPEERQWLGATERYYAFVQDFPDSPHTPTLWASMIRDLIRLKRPKTAHAEFQKLAARFPDHPATRRAAGEVAALNAVGRPFVLDLETREGQPAGTADYFGKVLIVHFWAGWNEESIKALPELVRLHEKHKEQGLALLGINVDSSPRAFAAALKQTDMPWEQYFDGKGMQNDVWVMAGVNKLPTYYVVDRQGILRAIDPPEGLDAYVGQLLKEPVKPVEFNEPGEGAARGATEGGAARPADGESPAGDPPKKKDALPDERAHP